MGLNIGVVIAAFCLTVLPEVLESLPVTVSLMFGILDGSNDGFWKPRGNCSCNANGFAYEKRGSEMRQEHILKVEKLW